MGKYRRAELGLVQVCNKQGEGRPHEIICFKRCILLFEHRKRDGTVLSTTHAAAIAYLPTAPADSWTSTCVLYGTRRRCMCAKYSDDRLLLSSHLRSELLRRVWSTSCCARENQCPQGPRLRSRSVYPHLRILKCDQAIETSDGELYPRLVHAVRN